MDILKKLNNINKYCCGCGACYNVCPSSAIKMIQNEQGFLYPNSDKDKCINCNKCINVCPKINSFLDNDKKPVCYAARATDDIRQVSSSGGIFTLIANDIIDNGGVVCGATMEKNFYVHHICIDNKNDLYKIRKSKYVQSDINDTFKKIKNFLDQGKRVLFSGCPCQVAAARNFFKKHDKVLFVDVLCHGVPSYKMWKDYINENFDVNQIKSIEFRSKLNGWRSEQLRVFYIDGTSEVVPWPESAYEEGFQRNICLRDGCENCEFCGYLRQGDLTLGDFWRIEDYSKVLNDHKGTSLLLVNNPRGRDLLNNIKNKLLDLTEVPIEVGAKYNRLTTTYEAHKYKKRFKTLYPRSHSFSEAVFQCRHSLYDIGLVSYYTTFNYGGQLTQFALYKALTDFGFSVLMIESPKDVINKPNPKGPVLFKRNPYPNYAISKYYNNISEMKFLNLQCHIFVSGSDQMFNHNGYIENNKFMVQNFVTDNKPKIAYAASWGHRHIWGGEQDRAEESYFIKKFDYFSVREKSAIKLCKEKFGVSATHVLDPVFIVNSKIYLDIIRENDSVNTNNYIFCYLLDVTKDKLKVVKTFSKKINSKILLMLDADFGNVVTNEINIIDKIEDIPNDIEILKNIKIEDWIEYIYKSNFVITDSFHGMCLCIILHKQFIVYINKIRGETRFLSVLEQLNLTDRIVYSSEDFTNKINNLQLINYTIVDKLLKQSIKDSLIWLYDSIKDSFSIVKPLSVYDILDGRCDYLIRKIDNNNDILKKKINYLNEQIQILQKQPIIHQFIYMKKIIRYYKNNGFKKTIKKIISKF